MLGSTRPETWLVLHAPTTVKSHKVAFMLGSTRPVTRPIILILYTTTTVNSYPVLLSRFHALIAPTIILYTIHSGTNSADVSREKGETTNTDPSLCSTPISLQRSQLILEEHSKEHAFMCSSDHPQLTARQTLEDYLARKLHTACKSKMAFRFLIQDKLKKTYLCVSNQ